MSYIEERRRDARCVLYRRVEDRHQVCTKSGGETPGVYYIEEQWRDTRCVLYRRVEERHQVCTI